VPQKAQTTWGNLGLLHFWHKTVFVFFKAKWDALRRLELLGLLLAGTGIVL